MHQDQTVVSCVLQKKNLDVCGDHVPLSCSRAVVQMLFAMVLVVTTLLYWVANTPLGSRKRRICPMSGRRNSSTPLLRPRATKTGRSNCYSIRCRPSQKPPPQGTRWTGPRRWVSVHHRRQQENRARRVRRKNLMILPQVRRKKQSRQKTTTRSSSKYGLF